MPVAYETGYSNMRDNQISQGSDISGFSSSGERNETETRETDRKDGSHRMIDETIRLCHQYQIPRLLMEPSYLPEEMDITRNANEFDNSNAPKNESDDSNEEEHKSSDSSMKCGRRSNLREFPRVSSG
ncbi:hypothetical protein TNCT_223661 [Trichonephila clavata]|uniref:Uncharacterized protein n=1 Tax=Trichonephila clavata TaxID=2740835 RepID=A0A8X6JCV1_TRICU|nr:hypothetical protein TNCT_223661 [Trichonephila clavata]